jgi:LacI family transcriptional regulator
MRDVAELAKVATMTVSRVLNDSASVTEETRNRVHDAIRQLNYQPDPVARALRQAKSKSIGIIVPNLYDPFFATCAHAIGLVAKKYQYTVILTTSDEDARMEFMEANLMVLNHVEGLAIIPAAVGKSQLDRPEFYSTHIVMLDRPLKEHRFNSVLVENQKGATTAVRHLIEHGHKRIDYLGLSDKLYTLNARYEGYSKAMKQAGLIPRQHFTCSTEEETYALIQNALTERKGPTAFFMGNNLVMRHALHAFYRLNVKVPDDVAIAGFDDFEMADILDPTVTVVRQPALELGRVAAELLFARITKKDESLSCQQIVLPVEFIVRESCGCNSRKASKAFLSKKA